MPNATVRATAQTLPETSRDAAIIERVNRRYNQPGCYEKGLEVLAKEMRDNEVDRKIIALHAEFQELQVKITSLRTRIAPLEVAVAAITKNDGAKKALIWGHQTEYWALNDEISDLELRLTDLVDSMIKLRPRKPAAIAAVAAAFKADQDHFWKEPEPERDRDISLLTRFLDSLIDLGSAPCVVDRVPVAHGEAARWPAQPIAAPSWARF
jgi:hypothetical protein